MIFGMAYRRVGCNYKNLSCYRCHPIMLYVRTPNSMIITDDFGTTTVLLRNYSVQAVNSTTPCKILFVGKGTNQQVGTHVQSGANPEG